jgi:hypothetical protein
MKIKSNEFYDFYFNSPEYWADYYYEDVSFQFDGEYIDEDEYQFDDEKFKELVINSKFISFDNDCGYVASNLIDQEESYSFKRFFQKWKKINDKKEKTNMLIEIPNSILEEVKLKLAELGVKVIR